jgi:hypothetical protein
MDELERMSQKQCKLGGFRNKFNDISRPTTQIRPYTTGGEWTIVSARKTDTPILLHDTVVGDFGFVWALAAVLDGLCAAHKPPTKWAP